MLKPYGTFAIYLLFCLGISVHSTADAFQPDRTISGSRLTKTCKQELQKETVGSFRFGEKWLGEPFGWDSFVVPFDEGERLHRLMKEAFEYVTNQKKIRAKWNANLTKAQLYAHGATDRNWFLDMIEVIRKPDMAKGYRLRMERHEASFCTTLGLHGVATAT